MPLWIVPNATLSPWRKWPIFATNVSSENETFFNHKCVCGEQNRQFFQTCARCLRFVFRCPVIHYLQYLILLAKMKLFNLLNAIELFPKTSFIRYALNSNRILSQHCGCFFFRNRAKGFKNNLVYKINYSTFATYL